VSSFGSPAGNVLYLIICAAPPARTVTGGIVRAAQRGGWDVSAIATRTALDWLPPDFAELTGRPVRTQNRGLDEPQAEPRGDAVLVAPATFNTINKWAAGINDTLALGLLNEGLGLQVPIAVLPWLNAPLRAHPVYEENVCRLTAAGVHFAAVDGLGDTDIVLLEAAALETLSRAVSARPAEPQIS
jgi:phosphopantothenoylcysteine decarboxylase